MLFVAFVMMFDYIRSSDRKAIESENTGLAIIPTDLRTSIKNIVLESFGSLHPVTREVKRQLFDGELNNLYCKFLGCSLEYLYSVLCRSTLLRHLTTSSSFSSFQVERLEKYDAQIQNGICEILLAFSDIKGKLMNILASNAIIDGSTVCVAIDRVHSKLGELYKTIEKFDASCESDNENIQYIFHKLIYAFKKSKKSTNTRQQKSLTKRCGEYKCISINHARCQINTNHWMRLCFDNFF